MSQAFTGMYSCLQSHQTMRGKPVHGRLELRGWEEKLLVRHVHEMTYRA